MQNSGVSHFFAHLILNSCFGCLTTSDLGYKNEIVFSSNTITKQIYNTKLNFSK